MSELITYWNPQAFLPFYTSVDAMAQSLLIRKVSLNKAISRKTINASIFQELITRHRVPMSVAKRGGLADKVIEELIKRETMGTLTANKSFYLNKIQVYLSESTSLLEISKFTGIGKSTISKILKLEYGTASVKAIRDKIGCPLPKKEPVETYRSKIDLIEGQLALRKRCHINIAESCGLRVGQVKNYLYNRYGTQMLPNIYKVRDKKEFIENNRKLNNEI